MTIFHHKEVNKLKNIEIRIVIYLHILEKTGSLVSIKFETNQKQASKFPKKKLSYNPLTYQLWF